MAEFKWLIVGNSLDETETWLYKIDIESMELVEKLDLTGTYPIEHLVFKDPCVYGCTTCEDPSCIVAFDLSRNKATKKSLYYGEGFLWELILIGDYLYGSIPTPRAVGGIPGIVKVKIPEVERVGRVDAPSDMELLSGMCTDGTNLYVLGIDNSGYARILKINLETFEIVGDALLSAKTYTMGDMVYLGGYVYASFPTIEPDGWAIFKIDPETLTEVTHILSTELGQDPICLTTDGQYLYAALYTNRKMLKIDPTDLAEITRIDLPFTGEAYAREMTFDGKYIYVLGDGPPAPIAKVDPETMSVVSTVELREGYPLSLVLTPYVPPALELPVDISSLLMLLVLMLLFMLIRELIEAVRTRE